MKTTVINLIDGYFIEVDEMNHTLKQSYTGKTKNGEDKNAERLIGYFSNVGECLERIVRLISLEESNQTVISLQEYAERAEKAFKQVREGIDAEPYALTETVKRGYLKCEVPSDCFDDIKEVRVIDEWTEEEKAFKQDNEWIPVRVSLPKPRDFTDKDKKFYLVQKENGQMEVAEYLMVLGAGWFAHSIGVKDVIAWRELPESYGSDRKENRQVITIDNTVKTNGDRIRSMADNELAKIILCPYDTAGDAFNIMPCVKDGNVQEFVSPEKCRECAIKWLQSEIREDSCSVKQGDV